MTIEIPELNLVIHDVVGGNLDHLEKLVNLHVESFPQWAGYVPYLRQIAQNPPDIDPRFVAHQWLVEIDQQVAALHAFTYVPQRNCGLGHYMSIKPAYRAINKFKQHSYLLQLLIDIALTQLETDAQIAKHLKPIGYVTEIIESGIVDTFNVLLKFIELPIEYHEPPWWPPLTDLTKLHSDPKQFPLEHLGIVYTDRFEPNNPTMLTDVVLAFLVDYYGLPSHHWAVKRALASIYRHLNKTS